VLRGVIGIYFYLRQKLNAALAAAVTLESRIAKASAECQQRKEVYPDQR
jgi:hypothetical protein